VAAIALAVMRDRGEAPGERVAGLRRLDPAGQRVDPLRRFARRPGQHVDRRKRARRRERPLARLDVRRVVPRARLRRDEAEPGQVRPDRVHQPGALKSRVLWCGSTARRPADFTGTNRMNGPMSASQIASASAVSTPCT